MSTLQSLHCTAESWNLSILLKVLGAERTLEIHHNYDSILVTELVVDRLNGVEELHEAAGDPDESPHLDPAQHSRQSSGESPIWNRC